MREEKRMLKISVIDQRTERWLVLEGKLISPWVAELKSAWRTANGQIGRSPVVVDLRNVTIVSQEGKNALLELMGEGAKFRCSGVLTKHVVQEHAADTRGTSSKPSQGAHSCARDD